MWDLVACILLESTEYTRLLSSSGKYICIIIVQKPNCHQRLVGRVDDVGDLVASNFHRWWLVLFHILETVGKISKSQILKFSNTCSCRFFGYLKRCSATFGNQLQVTMCFRCNVSHADSALRASVDCEQRRMIPSCKVPQQ